MSIKDGGPAFPADELHDQTPPYRHLLASQGMSLRDYFAAKAMAPLTASTKSGREVDAKGMAREAYMIADAMLAAREGK